MNEPPNLCDFTPLAISRADSRWLTVKDQGLPGVRVDAPGRFSKAQRLVNKRLEYRSETVDRWDRPSVAWQAQAGDCEEFALCKRAVLLNSGIPDDDLFFVLVNDLIQRRPHALLIARQGALSYILDIQGDIYRVETARDFMPIMCFTGTGAWIYGRPAP